VIVSTTIADRQNTIALICKGPYFDLRENMAEELLFGSLFLYEEVVEEGLFVDCWVTASLVLGALAGPAMKEKACP
jgi:hypothetical protein